MPTDIRLMQERNGVTFIDCLEAAVRSDLVKEWERLSGKKLVARSPLDKMIDEATGYSNGEYRDFITEQVRDYKAGRPPTIIGY